MKDARHRKPIVVSFSGLDGAGKSTQIENLRLLAQSLGLRDTLLTFWDNIVVLSRYREGFVQRSTGVSAESEPPTSPSNAATRMSAPGISA